MTYVALAAAIRHCLDRCAMALDAKEARDWAIAAALLIDRESPDI